MICWCFMEWQRVDQSYLKVIMLLRWLPWLSSWSLTKPSVSLCPVLLWDVEQWQQDVCGLCWITPGAELLLAEDACSQVLSSTLLLFKRLPCLPRKHTRPVCVTGTHPLQTALFSEAHLTLPSKHPLQGWTSSARDWTGPRPELGARSGGQEQVWVSPLQVPPSLARPAWQTHGIGAA